MQGIPDFSLRSTFEKDTFTKRGCHGSSSGDSFERREDEAATSLGSPSRWWEEAAEEVIRDSLNFKLVVRTIKFIPLLDPTTATTLLSKRHETWLKNFAKFLFRDEDIKELCHRSPSYTAEAIVAIIRGLPSSLSPRWNGGWFLNLLSSDIHETAEKLDYDIKSAICRISFPQWTAWFCGYQCVTISDLFDDLFNFRNTLAEHAQQHQDFLEKLVLLEKDYPSQQPLPRWILSTAIRHDVSSKPSDALVSFFKPIAQQFEKPSEQMKGQHSSISSVGQKLAILDARFTSKIVCHNDPEWSTPFSTNFSLWERIQKESPRELAESITTSVKRIFSKVSYHSLVVGDECTKDLARTSSDFVDEVFAYLSADQNLISYIMDLAEHFLHLRNVFSAAAIGIALQKWRYQPQQSSWVWDTINPVDHFSGCRKYAKKTAGCLPNIFTDILEVKLAKKDRADKIIAVLAMIALHLMEEVEIECKFYLTRQFPIWRLGSHWHFCVFIETEPRKRDAGKYRFRHKTPQLDWWRLEGGEEMVRRYEHERWIFLRSFYEDMKAELFRYVKQVFKA